MKNLIRRLNISEIEELPSRGKLNFSWYSRKWEYRNRTIDGVSIYTICQRVIDNNIGKSFALAFSYYCKLVPKRDQYLFLEEFSHKNRRSRQSDYFIDEDGLIQINKESFWYEYKKRKDVKKKEKLYITSSDYKTERVHIESGIRFDKFVKRYEKIEETISWKNNTLGKIMSYTRKINGKFLYYQYKHYKAQESDFHDIIVSGTYKYFESKNDPEFIRHFAEKRKAKKLSDKKWKKERKEVQYSFLSKSEQEAKKEKELNKQNILRHGFDPVTSFREHIIYEPLNL